MKKRTVMIPITVLVFAAAVYILGWSTLFTVSSVEIKGTDSILSATIEPGQKLARVEPRAVASDFERFDWVKSVDVSRNWINGKVTITLTKRTPIAIYNDRAIDPDGFSFIVGRENTVGLPRIQAPTIKSAITAAAFFTLLPAEIADAVQLVKVRSGDTYVMEVKKGTDIIEIFWGQDVNNVLKVKVYTALIAQPENSKIKRIDLSAPHAPIVK